MKIAVTDACIFIDLIELQIISEFFKLDIELHTTTDVVMELYPDQQEILKAYESGEKLVIHNLSADQISAMDGIDFPRGLSPEDRSVIYTAINLKDALILSSDKLVREYAGNISVEYHGIFWIFDQMVAEEILSKKVGASKITELLSLNIMYQSATMKREAERRIRAWG